MAKLSAATAKDSIYGLRGFEHLLKRVDAFVYRKEGAWVPSLNTGGLACTRWIKQGVGGKCLKLGQIRQAGWAACSESSQPLLVPLLWGEIALWLWALGSMCLPDSCIATWWYRIKTKSHETWVFITVKEDSDSIPDALEHVGEESQVALKIKLN